MSSTDLPNGYSAKLLLAKLGYAAGDSVLLVDAPAWFEQLLLDAGVTIAPQLPARWIHAFFDDEQKLTSWLKTQDFNKVSGGMWFSWPKKASGHDTSVNEQTFRDLLLPLGWVDTKVCSIDETWSGLKFLRRRG